MKFRGRRPAILAIAALWWAAGACGGGATSAPPSCPNDAPDTCPSPAPAYAADVAPIIKDNCVACHSPGGMEAQMPLQTYSQVLLNEDGIRFEVSACIMPPADQPQLTDAERLVILGWLACSAPND